MSSCQLAIDVSGGNAQREISSSSHQCVPVIVAPVFSRGVEGGSHGSEGTENIKTKHLSGVTGLKSSVVIEYA